MAAKRNSNRRSSRKLSPDGTQLMVLELQGIHSAENQLARELPRLNKAVESEKLREMLEQRLEQGERLIDEVESALEEAGESAGRKRNAAAEGLINDARQHVQQLEHGPALDAALIAAIQKTEHYCIAAWGTARSLAEMLGQKSAVRAMERALDEGKSMDEELTQLAEQEVNPAVMSAGAEQGMEQQEEERTGAGARGGRESGGRARKGRGSSRQAGTGRRSSGRGSSARGSSARGGSARAEGRRASNGRSSSSRGGGGRSRKSSSSERRAST